MNRTEEYMSSLAKEVILENIGFKSSRSNLHNLTELIQITIQQEEKIT